MHGLLLTLFFITAQSHAQSCSEDPVAQAYAQRVDAGENVQSCSECAALGVYFCGARNVWEEGDKSQYRQVIGQTQSNIREMGDPICCPELLNRSIEWGQPPAPAASSGTSGGGSSAYNGGAATGDPAADAAQLVALGASLVADIQQNRAERKAEERAYQAQQQRIKSNARDQLAAERDPRLMAAQRSAEMVGGVKFGQGWDASFTVTDGVITRRDASTGAATVLPIRMPTSRKSPGWYKHVCGYRKRCIDWSPDGKIIYYAGHDQSVDLYDARTGEHLTTIGNELQLRDINEKWGWELNILLPHFEISDSGARMVMNDHSIGVRVYDARLDARGFVGRMLYQPLKDWKDWRVEDVSYLGPKSQYVLTTLYHRHQRGHVRYLYDVTEDRAIPMPSAARTATFDPKSGQVYATDGDNDVWSTAMSALWAGTADWKTVFKDTGASLQQVVLTPDGSALLVPAADDSVILFVHDLRSGKTARYELNFQYSHVDIEFSGDGRVVYLSGSNWDHPVTRSYDLGMLIPE